jgi:hypothetical protein
MNNEASPTAPKDVRNANPDPIENTAQNTSFEDETEAARGGWRDTFRMALERARKEHKPRESRKELGRDRTKAFLVLVGGAVVLLLLFFGLFSRANKPTHLPGENHHGQPSLGQKLTHGQDTTDPNKAVIPMLSADVHGSDPSIQGQVTPEDVDRTSRTGHLAKPSPAIRTGSEPQDYALSRVDFSDPLVGKSTTTSAAPPAVPSRITDEADLKKPYKNSSTPSDVRTED